MINVDSICLLFFQGFTYHVKYEHNMWAYIFFFIHLDDTKANDYTALDLYVNQLVSSTIYVKMHINLFYNVD